jgi:hypothetical protein
MTKQLSILLIAAALSSVAQASIIFTNLGPGRSYDITQGNPVGNDFAGDIAAQGDTFTPTSTATLTTIEVALSCIVGCPASESFTVAFRADSSGAPGAVIESFAFVGTTLGALSSNNPLITATSILHPTLTAGTQYWVTVSASVNFAIAWNDNNISDPSDQAVSSDGGATWFSPSGMTPSAYEVDGTSSVPEPSTAILLSSAALLGLRSYRMKQGPCPPRIVIQVVSLAIHGSDIRRK